MLACEGLQGVDEGIGGIHLIEAGDIAHKLTDRIAFLEPIGLSAVEAHAAEAEGEHIWLAMAATVGQQLHLLAAELRCALSEVVHGGLGGLVVCDASGVAACEAFVAISACPVFGDVVMVAGHGDEGNAGVREAAHDALEVVVVVLAVAVHIAQTHDEVGRGHVVRGGGEDDALAARAPHAADVLHVGLHLLDAGAVVTGECQMGVREDDDGEVVLSVQSEASRECQKEGG